MYRSDGGFSQVPPTSAETLIDLFFTAVVGFRAIPLIIAPSAHPFVLAAAAIDIPQIVTGRKVGSLCGQDHYLDLAIAHGYVEGVIEFVK